MEKYYESYNGLYGGNLTELQQRYLAAFRAAEPMQRDGKPYHCLTMGFRTELGAEPFDVTQPLRRVEDVRSLSLTPIPLTGNRSRHRLNFADRPCRISDQTPVFAACDNLSYEAEAELFPRQDYFQYVLKQHNTNLTLSLGNVPLDVTGVVGIAQKRDLRTPISGVIRLGRHDELFDYIDIDSTPAFRFNRGDDCVEFVVQHGDHVESNQVIGSIVRSTEYQEIMTFVEGSKGAGVRRASTMRYIGRNVLPASRHLNRLRFVVCSLEAMVKYALTPANELQRGVDFLEDDTPVLPRTFLQFSSETISERERFGWKPSGAFYSEMCRLVGTSAKRKALAESGDSELSLQESCRRYLAVRAPVTGNLVSITQMEDGWELGFIAEDDTPHPVSVPGGTQFDSLLLPLLDKNEPVAVVAGQDLGDFLPRNTYYHSAAGIVAASSESTLQHLEDALFKTLLLSPGERNWRGRGYLLDRAYVGEDFSAHQVGYWLDFSNLEKFFVEEDCLYHLPPIPYSVAQEGLCREVNHVRYDFTPQYATGSRWHQTSRPQDAAKPKAKSNKGKWRGGKKSEA